MSFKIKASLHFKKDLKQLAKKYRKIKQDYSNLLKSLKNNPTLGTPLGDDIYKIRVPNSSIPTGKRGGFRVITLTKVQKETIILLTIYSKTDKDDISDDELVEILKKLESSF
jgi:mRNA-degrading endonuclease RelE of RelBE toxin-antitoxin system